MFSIIKARLECVVSSKASIALGQIQDGGRRKTVIGSLGDPPEDFREISVNPIEKDMKTHRREVGSEKCHSLKSTQFPQKKLKDFIYV